MKDRADQAQADTADARSDAELVREARCASGRAAFAALYHRYLTSLYRYFYA